MVWVFERYMYPLQMGNIPWLHIGPAGADAAQPFVTLRGSIGCWRQGVIPFLLVYSRCCSCGKLHVLLSACMCKHFQCSQRRQQASLLTSNFAALQRSGSTLGLQRIKCCLYGLGGQVTEGNVPEANVVGSCQVWGLESCVRWHSSVSRDAHTFEYMQTDVQHCLTLSFYIARRH